MSVSLSLSCFICVLVNQGQFLRINPHLTDCKGIKAVNQSHLSSNRHINHLSQNRISYTSSEPDRSHVGSS